MELIGEFQSMEEWESWSVVNAKAIETLRSINIEQAVKNRGVASSVFGKIPGSEVAIRSKNYRESIIVNQLNSRQRALIETLAQMPGIWNNPHATIYAAEAVTPFALFMRGKFSRFIGSEFTTDADRKANLFPIAIEDLTRLSFPDGCFDCTITNDVLEHVPSIPQALSQLRRITKKGGVHLSTFPFTNKANSICKAELINGSVVNHVEPEYHGNPMDPKGSLVFTVPGWDILEMARSAGFSVAKIIKYSSLAKAIWGANTPFIDIFYAEA